MPPQRSAPTRVPVKSSNVRSVGYDHTSGTLDVEFHSGGVYRYRNVPRQAHDALMGAKSKGRAMQALQSKYSGTKLA